jgi:hypothetical protein
VSQEQLDAVAAAAVAACAADPPGDALTAYLTARRALIDLVGSAGGKDSKDGASSSGSGGGGGGGGVVVDFTGVDSGKAEAVVRARRPGDGDAPFVSGLEESADGGDGPGIDRFRPVKRGVQLSPRMSLPAEAAARMNALKAAKRAEAALTARGGGGRPYPFRFWQPEEVPPADFARPEPAAGPDTLAALLTGLYSGLQARAGKAAGVAPGAAWRAALEAATENGAVQVILGERPLAPAFLGAAWSFNRGKAWLSDQPPSRLALQPPPLSDAPLRLAGTPPHNNPRRPPRTGQPAAARGRYVLRDHGAPRGRGRAAGRRRVRAPRAGLRGPGSRRARRRRRRGRGGVRGRRGGGGGRAVARAGAARRGVAVLAAGRARGGGGGRGEGADPGAAGSGGGGGKTMAG